MSHTITIYSTPSCVYCKMAKAYLTDKHIPYTEKDVQFDIAAREEMVRKSEQLGVPVIDIDGTIIVGFDKPRVDELLGLA